MKNDAVKEAFETITLKIESENDREKHYNRIYLRFLPDGWVVGLDVCRLS